jgi:hypothetical protein
MGNEFKGQIRGRNGKNVIQLHDVRSPYIQELKKSISRVPFNCNFEVRFRFPGKMFFDKQTSDGNNLPRNYDNSISMPTARNPIEDESYYQKYNPDVITYIEERIPFLTKNIGGFDESLELKDISLLNTKWSFGVRRNFDALKITFYDMYVQDKEGIMEWVCVSELFKTWIDNIFYNKVDKNKYNTYGTVLNYFNNYAIPKLEVLQFSNRLEVGDIKEYIVPKNEGEYNDGIFAILDKNGYWDSLKSNEDNLLAKYLNDLQYDRLRGGFRKNIIGIITSVLKPINDVINMVGVTSSFSMTLADGFENYNEKELNLDEWKKKRDLNQLFEKEEAEKFKQLETEITETSFELFEIYKEDFKNKLKPYDIVVTNANTMTLIGKKEYAEDDLLDELIDDANEYFGDNISKPKPPTGGFSGVVPTQIKAQPPKEDILDEIIRKGDTYFDEHLPTPKQPTRDMMDIFNDVDKDKHFGKSDKEVDGAGFSPSKELSKGAFKKAIEEARFAPRPAMFGQEDSAKVFSYLAEALAYVSVAYSIVDIAKIIAHKLYPESKLSPDWYADKNNEDILKISPSALAGTLAARYAGVDRFAVINFKDNYIKALIKFLIKNENKLKFDYPILFDLPLNAKVFSNIQEDERFRESNIGDDVFSQMNNIYDENKREEQQELYVNPIKTFVFYDVYPVGIAYESLDSENENLTTFTVTFKYTHFEQK